MKGFLLLSLVGAAIYTGLVVTHDLLPNDKTEVTLTGQNLGDAGDRQLHSWGTDLPALLSSQGTSLAVQKPGLATGLPESDHRRDSELSSGADSLPMSEAKPASEQSAGTAFEPTEWAKVILAARAHSQASVSSPTLRFYEPGTTLQVVSRDNDWLEVVDPASQQRGWVLEKYLASIENPNLTQAAMEAVPSNVVKPIASGAKQRNRSARTPRGSNDVALGFNPRNDRWNRRAERRGGFGLFFFRRYARAEAAQ